MTNTDNQEAMASTTFTFDPTVIPREHDPFITAGTKPPSTARTGDIWFNPADGDVYCYCEGKEPAWRKMSTFLTSSPEPSTMIRTMIDEEPASPEIKMTEPDTFKDLSWEELYPDEVEPAPPTKAIPENPTEAALIAELYLLAAAHKENQDLLKSIGEHQSKNEILIQEKLKQLDALGSSYVTAAGEDLATTIDPSLVPSGKDSFRISTKSSISVTFDRTKLLKHADSLDGMGVKLPPFISAPSRSISGTEFVKMPPKEQAEWSEYVKNKTIKSSLLVEHCAPGVSVHTKGGSE